MSTSKKQRFNIADHGDLVDGHQAQAVANARFGGSNVLDILEEFPSGVSTGKTPLNERLASVPAAISGPVRTHVSDVLDNPLNARHDYKESRIVKLSASISQHGQLQPVLACEMAVVRRLLESEDPAGQRATAMTRAMLGTTCTYMLIGGHYRKKAITRLPNVEIELKLVEPATLLDLYSMSYVENDERDDMSPLDNAVSWNNLLETGVARSHDDIAQVTNKSRTTILKTLALLKLPQPVLDLFREETSKYTMTSGYLLTQLQPSVDAARLLELAQRVATESITTRELEELVASASTPRPGRKVKQLSRQYKIKADGDGPQGLIKDWDSGRVVLDVNITNQSEREKLVAELRHRFGLDTTH